MDFAIIKNEIEALYPLFSVDVCTDSYAIEYRIIGAESVDDLADHLIDIFKDFLGDSYEDFGRRNMEQILEDKDNRIIPIKDSYTTTPYKILDTYQYYE